MKRIRCRRALIVTLVLGAAILVGVPSSFAQGDFVAYAQTEEGDLPLPTDLTEVDDLWTVRVKWGKYDGPKRAWVCLASRTRLRPVRSR
ncbi:MAG: hypothetical protein HC882_01600 [Acidobacteria bacterium]|nr:hypothetical protein [Acidobacteriota bacterium]